MNIAIIRHIGEGAPNKCYCFQLPTSAKLNKGTLVKVKTKMGYSYGELAYDSMEADGEALAFIRQSCGAPKQGELATVVSVLREKPVSLPAQESSGGWQSAKNGTATYRAKRKDNGKYIEGKCYFTTSDGAAYLGTRDTYSYISVGRGSGNIYNMSSAASEPIFVEVEAGTLEWRVET